jgi:hypothetical protein
LPPAPVRPLTVKLAFYDLLLMTAASLVLLIVTLNSPIWDLAVQAGLREADTQGVTIDATSLVTTTKIIIVVVFGIFAALYLFFAFMMYGGRNWARIVLTVLGALSVLTAVTPTTGSVTVNGSTYTATNYGINWVSGLLAVAAIVLMYLPQSNIYFRAAKAHRKGVA